MDRTPEELAERQRIHDLMVKAMDQEIWQMADLMAGKRNDQLFGETEFTLRDMVLKAGAKALEATVNDRQKGGTKATASSAQTAAKTRVSRPGDREPS